MWCVNFPPHKNLFIWSIETYIVVLKPVEIFSSELLHFPLRALQLNYYDLKELMDKTVRFVIIVQKPLTPRCFGP